MNEAFVITVENACFQWFKKTNSVQQRFDTISFFNSVNWIEMISWYDKLIWLFFYKYVNFALFICIIILNLHDWNLS